MKNAFISQKMGFQPIIPKKHYISLKNTYFSHKLLYFGVIYPNLGQLFHKLIIIWLKIEQQIRNNINYHPNLSCIS